ncbi:MAG TPA: LLM class flavin-dependent oxidoreductase [Chloroflexota bacterium]|nr:LLM class flavin-dependent oxidoreductase [Chloroflexota bacterium]
MIAAQDVMAERLAMYGQNKLKLGFFGANCSSGKFVSKAPGIWSGEWDDMLRLAQMADESGIDFILPIGRWKGYGGDTDYQGATYETIAWACGLLAATRRVTVFGTVHSALFPPLIAAKQIVTADHIGHGRFGLNIVCGWNEGEFEMFGVKPGDHDRRYRLGQEWLDVLLMIWERDDFDFKGEFFDLQGVREKPKPYGGGRPVIMNAGSSGDGRAFALRNCDAWFTSVRAASGLKADTEQAAEVIQAAKAEARGHGHEIGAYTTQVIVCRPTRKEAEDFYHHVAYELADWACIDNMLAMKGHDKKSPDEVARFRKAWASGNGGMPLLGNPDEVADELAAISAAGFDGCGISFFNYLDEFPYFRDEVLPRLEGMGLRRGPSAGG